MRILTLAAFVIAAPGSVLVFVPYLILRGTNVSAAGHGLATYVAALLFMAPGIMVLAWCVWNFFRIGKGTPAPIDPPKTLVVAGPYRCVRNPMYLAVAAILFGEAILFHSRVLLAYMLICWAGFDLFVVFYEEPTLRRKFGTSYDDYCRTTSRWLPHLPRGAK